MRSNGSPQIDTGFRLTRHIARVLFVPSGQGLHECGCLRKSAEEGSKAFSAFQSLQGRLGNDITRRVLSERAEPDALNIGHRM